MTGRGGDTPLKRLMGRHVGVTWLAASGRRRPDQSGTYRADFRRKQGEAAQRRFADSVQTLAVIRALLPK